jgi:hypothetical protein
MHGESIALRHAVPIISRKTTPKSHEGKAGGAIPCPDLVAFGHIEESIMSDYREELEYAIDAASATLPREAYGAAQWSLRYGPSGGGADVSWEDAITELKAWAETVDSVTLWEYGIDDDGEEVEYESGYVDSSDIIAGVIGKELAGYL